MHPARVPVQSVLELSQVSYLTLTSSLGWAPLMSVETMLADKAVPEGRAGAPPASAPLARPGGMMRCSSTDAPAPMSEITPMGSAWAGWMERTAKQNAAKIGKNRLIM